MDRLKTKNDGVHYSLEMETMISRAVCEINVSGKYLSKFGLRAELEKIKRTISAGQL
jgi:hypothetical protein